MITRRQALLSTLFGGGMVGLRALATGLPASLLLDPRRAIAGDPPPPPRGTSPQFVIFNTSSGGDPINASVPGTYEDPGIVHAPDPAMGPASLSIRGQTFTAARPWTTLAQSVLDRMVFWHLMTDTPVHPKEPDVLGLMGAASGNEMLPSIMAKQLAPLLGTIQSQPISLGATSPSEALRYDGQALPIIPPIALKTTLTAPTGPLAKLQALRDQTLDQLYDLYKNDATPAQQKYIDSMVTSQRQLRNIEQKLLDRLATIADNGPMAQILAAITLVQMKVTPLLAINIPFGGDNHRDVGFKVETAQTLTGVATIAALMDQLASAGLADYVSFVSLNVFGRTLGAASSIDGRKHNPNHQVSLAIGKPFRGGVIGGVGPVDPDYGALPIDPLTGRAERGGSLAPKASLAAFGRTILTAAGVDPALVPTLVTGELVPAALAT